MKKGNDAVMLVAAAVILSVAGTIFSIPFAIEIDVNGAGFNPVIWIFVTIFLYGFYKTIDAFMPSKR